MAAESGNCDDVDACNQHWHGVHWAGGWKRGGYERDFLEVVLRRLLEGRFGRMRTVMKMMEMSRDNKHEEDVMTRSMFETLCEGKPSLLSSTARLKHRLSATTAARTGGADPSRMKQSRMGRGQWQRRNGGCVGDNNYYEQLHTMHKTTRRHS